MAREHLVAALPVVLAVVWREEFLGFVACAGNGRVEFVLDFLPVRLHDAVVSIEPETEAPSRQPRGTAGTAGTTGTARSARSARPARNTESAHRGIDRAPTPMGPYPACADRD